MDFFLDTYAMIEIAKGSKNYEPYLDNLFLTTKYNLAELHYFLLTNFDLNTADFYLRKFAEYAVDFDVSVISKAMALRKSLKAKKLKISYIDCIGYVVAATNSAKFLTGDHHFKDLGNVEFVR